MHVYICKPSSGEPRAPCIGTVSHDHHSIGARFAVSMTFKSHAFRNTLPECSNASKVRGAGRLLRRHVPRLHPFHAHSTCVSRPMPMARRHWLPHCRSTAASRFGLPPLALACAITECLTVINHFSYPCVTLWTREAPTSPSFISLHIYRPHHLYVDEEAVVVAVMRRPVLLQCMAQTPSVCVASRSL